MWSRILFQIWRGSCKRYDFHTIQHPKLVPVIVCKHAIGPLEIAGSATTWLSVSYGVSGHVLYNSPIGRPHHNSRSTIGDLATKYEASSLVPLFVISCVTKNGSNGTKSGSSWTMRHEARSLLLGFDTPWHLNSIDRITSSSSSIRKGQYLKNN